MILNFKHKGLSRFVLKGEIKGIAPSHKKRIKMVLNRLDSITVPEQMNQPGLNLHPLKGELIGYFSVKVSANWRITFRMDGENVCDVDYLNYH